MKVNSRSVNFNYSEDMTQKDIEDFTNLIYENGNNGLFDAKHLEGKVVSKSDYPSENSFKIGKNVHVSNNGNVQLPFTICCGYKMFDNLALLAGETAEDRLVIEKIIENWETVKNFVEMLDT